MPLLPLLLRSRHGLSIGVWLSIMSGCLESTDDTAKGKIQCLIPCQILMILGKVLKACMKYFCRVEFILTVVLEQ